MNTANAPRHAATSLAVALTISLALSCSTAMAGVAESSVDAVTYIYKPGTTADLVERARFSRKK